MDELHHSDIVTHALIRYSRDWSRNPDEIENELRRGAGQRALGAVVPPRQLEPPQPGTKPYEGPERRSKTAITDTGKDKFQGF